MNNSVKPFAESCVQNRAPILKVLKTQLDNRSRLLEVGSGTGQHAVYFAPEFPQLVWQTGDLLEAHPGISAWLDEYRGDNILSPVDLEVCEYDWPQGAYDVVYSANAVHIMSWSSVECLFPGVGRTLEKDGRFILYGPFNYNGDYTSVSNASFDEWLKARDPLSGIRDFEAVNKLAASAGMSLTEDYEMPANNRILVWEKQ